VRPFSYRSAATVDDALALLGRDGAARPLAGGTDLLTLMKGDLAEPALLVDIKRAGDLPSGIEEGADGITFGALATLADVETSPLARARAPALAEAAALAATPQLRNLATIGGNVLQRPRCWYFRNRHVACWLKGGEGCPAREGENQYHALFGGGPCLAVHPSDLAPALVALDAEVRLRGRGGERSVALADLFALPEEGRRTETRLADDELIVAIRVPAPAAGARSTYLKAMDRRVWAFALVGVAVSARVEDGRVADARVVLAGVAPIPWRVRAAEEVLRGSSPSEEVLARAAEAALAGAQPLGQNGYKVPLARVLVRRALAAVTAL
jgi:xanthine dehydrogenase YagS FAD-binding subunit